MHDKSTKAAGAKHGRSKTRTRRFCRWIIGGTGALAAAVAASGVCADASDPLLDVLIKKGFLTEQEAKNIKAEAEANQTNAMPSSASKWKLGPGIKNIELLGDLRARYEYRSAQAPGNEGIILNRYRYALRLGLRGDLFDDFYYGLRLETAANPRSPWLTFGTSSSGTPWQGPFGKSTAGINLGQAYIGWRPENWVDLIVGKMPNPLYTTPMVWDTDLNPEGLAERFKYTAGPADFFSTFGQFVYQDTNPSSASAGLITSFPAGQSANPLFILAWQAGVNYHINETMSAKIAPTLYNYTSHGHDTAPAAIAGTPGFSDTFVGQGAPNDVTGALGAGSNIGKGGSGSDGFYFNQTGVNDLLVLDVPFEFNFKLAKLNARAFGDFAVNLEGSDRAAAAAASAAAQGFGFPAQKDENKAYQFGLALGSSPLGLVYGTVSKKNTWEVRTYWQHVEQYALDPNLLDSDFFEGRGNLEGVYSSVGYSFTDGIIGTLRYGYASRINNQLGTGGSNQDIPQVNPINHYQILQLDLTYRF